MQKPMKPQLVPDNIGVSIERYLHINIPSVNAARALLYPEMSAYYECDADYCCARASHLGLLMMYITSGSLSVCSWRGEVEASAGDTVLLETYRPHVYCASRDSHPCFYWLHFDGAAARALTDYIIQQNEGILFKLPQEHGQLFSHFIMDLSHKNLTELQQSARIYELLTGMERPDTARTPGQLAVSYMQRHYAEPIRIADFAAEVNLSPSHFCACFKDEFGISPHRYLIEYRLSVGYNMVCGSSRSVEEIHALTGYSSPSAFISAFSKKYGQTPAQLRKSLHTKSIQ